ncbi:MAG: transketolase [Planctomycetes bacterium]|nr:transketolase [Planctomycetota bacterium]
MPELTPQLQQQLTDTARRMRISVVRMLTRAGSGHPGGSLGMADVFTALYFGGWVRHDPKNPKWEDRDRVVLSNGHICPILYAALAERGFFPAAWLDELRRLGSHLQGHPAMHKTPGIELSTGSLGHGVCGALGMALALRADSRKSRVFTLLGDGELQEGLPWESFMAAAHYKADNLCIIVDRNDAQIDGRTRDVMNIDPLDAKLRAFGLHVVTADGHDFRQLFAAFAEAEATKGKPTAIIATTVMGKGVSYMEKEGHKWHGKTPSKDQAELALKELGA